MPLTNRDGVEVEGLLCIYCHQTIVKPLTEPAPQQCQDPKCGRWTCYITTPIPPGETP